MTGPDKKRASIVMGSVNPDRRSRCDGQLDEDPSSSQLINSLAVCIAAGSPHDL